MSHFAPPPLSMRSDQLVGNPGRGNCCRVKSCRERALTEIAKQQKPKRIIKQRQSLSEKQPGTTIFPTSRIKKIIKADKDLDMMTAEAVFMVGVATVRPDFSSRVSLDRHFAASPDVNDTLTRGIS